MDIFNVSWNRHDNNEKYIIGHLIHDGIWFFKYNNKAVKIAIKNGFRPFPEMSNINKTYSSSDLFRTFSSRVSSKIDSIEVLKTDDLNLLTDNILVLHKKGKQ